MELMLRLKGEFYSQTHKSDNLLNALREQELDDLNTIIFATRALERRIDSGYFSDRDKTGSLPAAFPFGSSITE